MISDQFSFLFHAEKILLQLDSAGRLQPVRTELLRSLSAIAATELEWLCIDNNYAAAECSSRQKLEQIQS